MDENRRNGSGCIDNVAFAAISKADKESKAKEKFAKERDAAAEMVIKTIKNVTKLAGFRLIHRIEIEDTKTGKQYL